VWIAKFPRRVVSPRDADPYVAAHGHCSLAAAHDMLMGQLLATSVHRADHAVILGALVFVAAIAGLIYWLARRVRTDHRGRDNGPPQRPQQSEDARLGPGA
jgi:hypothetical protein